MKPATVDTQGAPNKKLKTRHRLLDAARSLVDERDSERVSIADITQRADVGLGTFYNYFDNKQAIFEAVLDEMRSSFEARLAMVRSAQTDPASLVAATLKFCLTEALENSDWHRFIERSGMDGEFFLLQSHDQCLEDVLHGTRKGRFKVDNPEFVTHLILGMTHHVTREIRAGRLSTTAVADTTRYVLRMLGLPELVAKAVTQAPLPPVAAQKRQVAKEILPFLTKRNQLNQ